MTTLRRRIALVALIVPFLAFGSGLVQALLSSSYGLATAFGVLLIAHVLLAYAVAKGILPADSPDPRSDQRGSQGRSSPHDQ